VTTSSPFLQKMVKNILAFFHDPFGTIDSIDLNVKGFQFNILRDDQQLCKALLEIFVLVPLLCWVLLGADSTIDQVAWLLYHLPSVITGSITVHQWLNIYGSYYGLGTHWSASVIYGLLLIGVSRYLWKHHNVVNSFNLAITTGFVGLAISSFEFFWMISYYVFQNQPWILSFQPPQFRIIRQGFIFLLPALVVLFGLNWKDYTLNFNKRTLFLFLSTIFFVILWINYPFPVEPLSVEIVGYGTWTSSPQFPQTMYTIDMDVTDSMAVGEMFHIDNPAVHFVNNMCKIFWTLTIYNLAKIKKR